MIWLLPVRNKQWVWLCKMYVLEYTCMLRRSQVESVLTYFLNTAALVSKLWNLMYIYIYIYIYSFQSHYGPGVDSASNRNEYQEYFLGVKAAGAYGWQPYHLHVPLSRNLWTLTSWNPLGLSRPEMGLLYICICYSNGRRLLISKHLSSNNFFPILTSFRNQLILKLTWMTIRNKCVSPDIIWGCSKIMWCSELRSWNK